MIKKIQKLLKVMPRPTRDKSLFLHQIRRFNPSWLIATVCLCLAVISGSVMLHNNLTRAAAVGIDSISTSANPTSFQTFNDLQNNTTPPDLTLTIQVQVNSSYTGGGRIELPLDYNPTAQGLANFDTPATKPNFFNIKTLPNLVDYPFIASFDQADPAKLVINLKSAVEAPSIVGLKTILITFEFNSDYTGKVPRETVLWRPAPVVYVGAENLAATPTTVKSSATAQMAHIIERMMPSDDKYIVGRGLSVRLQCRNYYYYENYYDTSYNNHCYIDVPAGSTIVTGLASMYSYSSTVTDGSGSYDRYIHQIDDTPGSWNLWHYGNLKYNVALSVDITILPPSSLAAGQSFNIRQGANYKRINAEPANYYSSASYAVTNPLVWDLYKGSGANSVGDVTQAVSGINNGNVGQANLCAGYVSYVHFWEPKNLGSGPVSGANIELKQLTAESPKLNYATVVLYTARDTTNPANIPAWSRYRSEYVIKNALTGAERVEAGQNYTPTATGGVQNIYLTLPALGANEYVDTVRVTPTGTDGVSDGVLPSRNGFGFCYNHKAWPNRTWPDGTTVSDTSTPVQTQWTLNYYDNPALNGGNTTVAKQFKSNVGTMWYSSQPAARGQLVSSQAQAGVAAGSTVSYTLIGVNDAHHTVVNWDNPRLVARVPNVMTLVNQPLQLFDANGSVVPSAVVTPTLLGSKDGYKYYQFQVTNYSAPEVGGASTPAFTIPLDFSVISTAEARSYTLGNIVVSSDDPANFYTSTNIGVNHPLPAGTTKADYGFATDGVYSVSSLASTNLLVLPFAQLNVGSAVKSSATGGLYVNSAVVPTMYGETAQMKLTITNTGNVGFTKIRLYDILPVAGDALGSTGGVTFSGVSGATSATIKYTTDAVSGLPSYGAHGGDNPNLQTATFADGWTTSAPSSGTTAVWIDLDSKVLAPDESIDIILNLQIPSSGNQTAINQFRYSAVEVGSTNPPLNQNSLPQGFSTEMIGLIYHDNLPPAAEDEADDVPDAEVASFIAGISDSLTVDSATPTLTNYDFMGWNTAADGSGEDYTAGRVVNFSAAQTVNLYAQWKLVEYTVSFESNGGSPVPGESVGYNQQAVRPTEPKRLNFTFDGWFVDEELTTPFDFATPVVTNIVLYAKWVDGAQCEYDSSLYADDEECQAPGTGLPGQDIDVPGQSANIPGAPNSGLRLVGEIPILIISVVALISAFFLSREIFRGRAKEHIDNRHSPKI